jgi:hypothetical protein
VRLVLAERFGVPLQSFVGDYDSERPQDLADMVSDALPLVGVDRVEAPREGDLALMIIRGQPCHVGVVVGRPGERNMLHTLNPHDSVLDYYDGTTWRKRLEGFYRVR